MRCRLNFHCSIIAIAARAWLKRTTHMYAGIIFPRYNQMLLLSSYPAGGALTWRSVGLPSKIR
jgi:hypothetical protein